MKRFFFLFTSRRFAIYLFSIEVGFLLLGGMRQTLNLPIPSVEEIVYSPPFILCTIFLVISTILCNIRRFSNLYGEVSSGTYFKEFDRFFSKRLKDTKKFLKLSCDKDENVVYLRGLTGLIFSAIFHLSIVVFLIGILIESRVIDVYEVILAEGQDLKGCDTGFVKKIRGRFKQDECKSLIDGGLRLIKYMDYKDPVTGYPKKGIELFFYRSQNRGMSFVNRPLKIGNRVYQLHRAGVSPDLVIKDIKTNRIIFNGLINIRVTGETMDAFDVPDTDLSIIFKGEFPDTEIEIFEGPKMLYSGKVKLNQPFFVGGFEFIILDVRNWASFLMYYDREYSIVLISLFTGMIALFLRQFFPWIAFFVRKDQIYKIRVWNGVYDRETIVKKVEDELCG